MDRKGGSWRWLRELLRYCRLVDGNGSPEIRKVGQVSNCSTLD